MRWVIVRVLPVPAPARTQTGPRGASTASRCSSSRSAIKESAITGMASILAVIADKRLAAPRRGIPLAIYVCTTMSNASITMYCTQWCGYCHRLKTALKSGGIAYDEVDIEQDPAAADFVGSINGGNHVVPTLKF